MQSLPAGAEKQAAQQTLREQVRPGNVDVNVMTKLDRSVGSDGAEFGPESSDALAAVRGYAKSTLRSSLVLSAGMNPRLFSYIARLEGLSPNPNGELEKQIVLKVSDFRSALVQGKFLAKKGRLGLRVPDRVGSELWRTRLPHQGAAPRPRSSSSSASSAKSSPRCSTVSTPRR